jgi:peptide methionine sulfoxide reductase MsrA
VVVPRSRKCLCFFAEDYHQQYLYKVPHGYCPDHSTGVSCPVGLIKAD